jgi:hypothetical protein
LPFFKIHEIQETRAWCDSDICTIKLGFYLLFLVLYPPKSSRFTEDSWGEK